MKVIIFFRLCYIFCFFIPLYSISNVEICFEGLDSKLEYSVRKQLDQIQIDDAIRFDIDIQKKLINLVEITLKSLGFYEAHINIIVLNKRVDNDKSDVLIVRINSGLPVKVVKINISVCGDGTYDPDYQQIIKDSESFLGKVLHHNDYEQLKSRLYNLAISKGYLDAKFQNSQLVVIPSLYQCMWNICLNSGVRYVIKEIRFQGNQIKENYLRNISDVYLGKCYHTKLIAELNRRLFTTNWFNSIFTSLDSIEYHQKKNWC